MGALPVASRRCAICGALGWDWEKVPVSLCVDCEAGRRRAAHRGVTYEAWEALRRDPVNRRTIGDPCEICGLPINNHAVGSPTCHQCDCAWQASDEPDFGAWAAARRDEVLKPVEVLP